MTDLYLAVKAKIALDVKEAERLNDVEIVDQLFLILSSLSQPFSSALMPLNVLQVGEMISLRLLSGPTRGPYCTVPCSAL